MEWLYPETTKNFTQLPLQYRVRCSYCGLSLIGQLEGQGTQTVSQRMRHSTVTLTLVLLLVLLLLLLLHIISSSWMFQSMDLQLQVTILQQLQAMIELIDYLYSPKYMSV